MPVQSLLTPLQTGRFYHVYNRGNNKERLFHFTWNYDFFLEKYFLYLDPFVETYSYCLLPNHFHFLIRIKDHDVNPKKVSNQLRRLFICYARYINAQEKRAGCLLSKNYRRIEIKNESYLRRIVLYIHYNPVKHGVSKEFTNYPYSTFNQIILNKMSEENIREVLEWFGGFENFLEYHRIKKDDKRLKSLKLED
jgi:putative transposase